jgi:hypothetical protein
VHAHPQFFQRPDEPFMPFEREEEPDPPPPPPKPAPRMLRSRKTWSSGPITFRGPFGDEPLTISLHEGRTVREDTPWLQALSVRQRAELFEEVS